NPIRPLRETFLQKFLRVIGLCDASTRWTDKLVQPDLEISRRENIVGVSGKAESEWEKSADPKSGARGHSSEVCVNVTNPDFLQAQSDISCLIKTEKIGTPAPLIDSADNLFRELSCFRSAADFAQQLFFTRQIMDTLDNLFVPVLQRLIFRLANGKDRRRRALSSKFGDLSVAKRLSE